MELEEDDGAQYPQRTRARGVHEQSAQQEVSTTPEVRGIPEVNVLGIIEAIKRRSQETRQAEERCGETEQEQTGSTSKQDEEQEQKQEHSVLHVEDKEAALERIDDVGKSAQAVCEQGEECLEDQNQDEETYNQLISACEENIMIPVDGKERTSLELDSDTHGNTLQTAVITDDKEHISTMIDTSNSPVICPSTSPTYRAEFSLTVNTDVKTNTTAIANNQFCDRTEHIKPLLSDLKISDTNNNDTVGPKSPGLTYLRKRNTSGCSESSESGVESVPPMSPRHFRSGLLMPFGLLATQTETEPCGLIAIKPESDPIGLFDTKPEIDQIGLLAKKTETDSNGLLGTKSETDQIDLITTNTETDTIGLLTTKTETDQIGLLTAKTETDQRCLLSTNTKTVPIGLLPKKSDTDPISLISTKVETDKNIHSFLQNDTHEENDIDPRVPDLSDDSKAPHKALDSSQELISQTNTSDDEIIESPITEIPTQIVPDVSQVNPKKKKVPTATLR